MTVVKHCLILTDDMVWLEMVSTALGKRGWEVVTRRPPENEVHVAVLDWRLQAAPKVCQSLRNAPGSHVVIAMVESEHVGYDALSAGANSYLLHPVSSATLITSLSLARSLVEAEERARLLLDTADDYAVIMIDLKGTITDWSRGAERILGYTSQEAVGHPIDLIFTRADVQQGAPGRELTGALERGHSDDIRWHQRKDGTLLYGFGTVNLMRDAQGAACGYLKVMHDFTSRHLQQVAVEAAYAREHRLAAALQRTLLRDIDRSKLDGLEVETWYEPASEESRIGGDFFDVFRLQDGLIALVVGDVSGKGLQAAERTAEVRYTLRAFLTEDPNPAHALHRVNAFLLTAASHNQRDEGEFVAVSVGVINRERTRIQIAVAGMDPPMLIGCSWSFDRAFPVLGIGQADYESETVDVKHGDVLVMFTDGLVEVRQGDHFLSTEGLRDIAAVEVNAVDLVGMGDGILTAARTFGQGFRDDVCLLLARFGSLY